MNNNKQMQFQEIKQEASSGTNGFPWHAVPPPMSAVAGSWHRSTWPGSALHQVPPVLQISGTAPCSSLAAVLSSFPPQTISYFTVGRNWLQPVLKGLPGNQAWEIKGMPGDLPSEGVSSGGLVIENDRCVFPPAIANAHPSPWEFSKRPITLQDCGFGHCQSSFWGCIL